MFEDMNEINEMMGRSYGISDGVTDEDLEAELAGLEDELEG
jgi:charged multivesicular body protein 5